MAFLGVPTAFFARAILASILGGGLFGFLGFALAYGPLDELDGERFPVFKFLVLPLVANALYAAVGPAIGVRFAFRRFGSQLAVPLAAWIGAVSLGLFLLAIAVVAGQIASYFDWIEHALFRHAWLPDRVKIGLVIWIMWLPLEALVPLVVLPFKRAKLTEPPRNPGPARLS